MAGVFSGSDFERGVLPFAHRRNFFVIARDPRLKIVMPLASKNREHGSRVGNRKQSLRIFEFSESLGVDVYRTMHKPKNPRPGRGPLFYMRQVLQLQILAEFRDAPRCLRFPPAQPW